MLDTFTAWKRVARAVELVHDRLRRSTEALERAEIPYAVIGGNAVAVWVGRVDQSAVRNTHDVDILIHRNDFETVKTALESVGFVFRHSAGIDMFLDGPGAKARDAVRVLFAGQKVRPEYLEPTPDVSESEMGNGFRTLSLEALTRMKLTSFRDKDRTHLRDMIEVGLLDESWLPRFRPELAVRLKELIDTPDG